MRIIIKLDKDEITEFAKIPERMENIFMRLDDMGMQINSIQREIAAMPRQFQREIINRIGG